MSEYIGYALGIVLVLLLWRPLSRLLDWIDDHTWRRWIKRTTPEEAHD